MKFIIAILITALAASKINACDDIAKDCNLWAALCNSTTPFPYVEQNCKATCGNCEQATTPAVDCVDVALDCEDMLDICENTAFHEVAWNNCRRSCGLCSVPCPCEQMTTESYQCIDMIGTASCEKMSEFCDDSGNS
uniref:ShKT domain-containing protein n=1 Tax=Rhabditophanes sp. KR3021 TaxID=114890 RepID=A0AC35TTG5_9BILA